MPVHDWPRVGAGIFHDFHHSWIDEIKAVLNDRLLPPGYYALIEQSTATAGPDVLAVGIELPHEESPLGEMDQYVQKPNRVVIRRNGGDRIVALVEIVLPGSKASRNALRNFVDKAATALWRGYHLLVLDLQPPSPHDPQGIHGVLWEEIGDTCFRQPENKPLTIAAYEIGQHTAAYVEPVAVGDPLPDMPLFLEPGQYILVPLEATYQAAWQRVPQRWRRVLESPADRPE